MGRIEAWLGAITGILIAVFFVGLLIVNELNAIRRFLELK